MQCPNGHEVPDGSKFCNECGAVLLATPPRREAPPVDVPALTAPPNPVKPEGPHSPQQRESRRLVWIGVVALLILGVILAGAIAGGERDTAGGGASSPAAIANSSMPRVLMESFDAARLELEALGLDLNVLKVEEERAELESGLVIGTDPPVGTELSAGDTVTLYVVASEPPCVANPDLAACQPGFEEGGQGEGGGGGGSGGSGGSNQEGSGNGAGPTQEIFRFGDGSWVVPQDVKPGIYRARDPGPNCYWQRVKNFRGGLNSIIANGLAIGGPIVIEVKRSDAGVESNGCGEWTTNLSRASQSRDSVGDGIWIVKTDMAPGTYRTTVRGGNCYWARLRAFDGGLNSVAANALPPRGGAVVEIGPADAGFETHGCGTWKKA
jgi:hypothetical protein